jgi:hypothetical protein
VHDQLKYGVRYFDMRVVWDGRDGRRDYFFVHMLEGPTIVSMLDEMERFLAENPREVILLDFNHLYLGSKKDSDELKAQRRIEVRLYIY